MAVAAFTAVLKQTGTAVSMTTEACSSISASVYQITNTAKRIIDPATALSVIDNGGAVADADVTIDYLFGKITKNSGSFTGPVTITGAYLPTHALAEVRSFEFTCSRDLLEDTVMAAATANRSRATVGLKDCRGSIQGLDPLTTDLDSGGTTIVPHTDFGAGTRRVFEVTFPGGVIFRAFMKYAKAGGAAERDGLFEGTLEWEADAATGTDQTEGSSFGFSSGG